MDLKALGQQIAQTLVAPTYGANVNDSAPTAGMNANIRALSALQGQGDAGARATGSLGVAAGQQADNELEARKAAAEKAKQALAEQESEIKRLSDPKNYQAVINDAGGYDFYNPDGQKISPVDYAKATNQHITDLYKNSQDPNDKDFTEDYNKVLEIGKIIQSGDKKARDKFFQQNPDWKQAFGNSSYNDIVKSLRDQYPGYFRSDQELTRQDNYQNKTLNTSTPDQRNWVGKVTDQLIPSFLGNTKTYKRGY